MSILTLIYVKYSNKETSFLYSLLKMYHMEKGLKILSFCFTRSAMQAIELS